MQICPLQRNKYYSKALSHSLQLINDTA